MKLPNGNNINNVREYVNYLVSMCSFDFVNRLGLCLGMCHGLCYLHNNGFLHKFLSHRNVMVNGTINHVVVMLSDFGEFNSPIVEGYEFEEVGFYILVKQVILLPLVRCVLRF